MKTNQKNDFKFRFRKSKYGKILNFDPKQLDNYRVEVKCDFISILMKQLKAANTCNINLDYDLQLLGDKWINEYNEKNSKIETTLFDMHHHRAIISYCSQSINMSCITEFKLICQLLEEHYKMRDTRDENI